MSPYTPDRWVVVAITDTDTNEGTLRVLAGWYGGYVSGDSWKLSSGIIADGSIEYDDRYEFLNHSGSVYVCYKRAHGMSTLMASVYAGFQKQMTDTLRIEMLSEHGVKQIC